MMFFRKSKSIALLVISFLLLGFVGGAFKDDQMRYQRVRTAYEQKLPDVKQTLSNHNISNENLNVYIRVFKQEGELELWGKNRSGEKFQLLKTFEICDSSGKLGPKREQGDRQVPEGFYHIDRFNPSSNYYLSMGVNYPNKSDRILGNKAKLGGDIFIHGACVTIGCVPLTDDKIKELYVYCVEAKNAGQKTIPVTFFPARLTKTKLSDLVSEKKPSNSIKELWADLSQAYLLFQSSKTLPSIAFLENGDHAVK
jgi:murein L,D-transpeptidase YafK